MAKQQEETRWYIRRNGQAGGPYEEAQIQLWLKAKRIGGESFVRREGEEQWVPIAATPFWGIVRRRSRTPLIIVGGIFGLLVIGIITGNKKTNTATAPASAVAAEPHNKIGAWIAGKQFVTRALKSPSSADFGGMFEQSPDEHVTYLGDGKYSVEGWVDAQNSFGAKIRNRFHVGVQWENNGWDLISGPSLSEQ